MPRDFADGSAEEAYGQALIGNERERNSKQDIAIFCGMERLDGACKGGMYLTSELV